MATETATEKISALKSAFDAMIIRVEAKLLTPADFTTIDDMTTRATDFASGPAPTPVPPAPVTPVEPMPPAPPAP